jgi:hypothetical protein
MFGRRPDAERARDLSATRAFMPFISPRRNDSLVYFSTEIEVDAALRFLEERNRARPPERRMTLFHLYLRSVAMALAARPNLNRFTAGGRIWQRDGVWLTFSAKQEIVDGAPVLTLKRRFDEDESLDAMADAICAMLRERRGGRRTTSDREVSLALRLPAVAVRGILGALRFANELGLLPRTMIEADPMFTSVFVANLGSVGLDAGYHHLWEYGTCPIFAAIGRVRERPDGRHAFTVKYTYDERIEDGLYAAIALEGVRERLENPEKLL